MTQSQKLQKELAQLRAKQKELEKIMYLKKQIALAKRDPKREELKKKTKIMARKAGKGFNKWLSRL